MECFMRENGNGERYRDVGMPHILRRWRSKPYIKCIVAKWPEGNW
jgi:hypothetical protein